MYSVLVSLKKEKEIQCSFARAVDETGLHGFAQNVSCAKSISHLVYSRNVAL